MKKRKRVILFIGLLLMILAVNLSVTGQVERTITILAEDSEKAGNNFLKTLNKKSNQKKKVWKKSAADKEEFIKEVYQGLLERQETIRIEYTGNDYKKIHDRFLDQILREEILEMDSNQTSDDYDYMKYNLNSIKIKTSSGGFWLQPAQILITVEWKESARQLKKVNAEVEKILGNLSLEHSDTYEKIRKIHDYVLERVEYDHSLSNFTAYEALFQGEATCQGYMLLVYKLLTDAGVPTRCIDGQGLSEGKRDSHGWNIVQIGDLWYNLDATWNDAGAPSLFFLKGEEEFGRDHFRDEVFLTESFMKKYPMSFEDYDLGQREEISEETYISEDRLDEEDKQSTSGDNREEDSGIKEDQQNDGIPELKKKGISVSRGMLLVFIQQLLSVMIDNGWKVFWTVFFIVLFVKIIKFIHRHFL